MKIQRIPTTKIMISKKMENQEGKKGYFLVDKIEINNWGPIRTEGHFCYYILKKFGVGRYSCRAFRKGKKSFWNFWTGTLYEQGYGRDVNQNIAMEKLKKELQEAQDWEEREMIEDEMDLEREISHEEKKGKRFGPLGLKKSKPGQLNEYEAF